VGDGTLRLWDVETGRELQRMAGIRKGIHGVALSPVGRPALIGGADYELQLWDLEEVQRMWRFDGLKEVLMLIHRFSSRLGVMGVLCAVLGVQAPVRAGLILVTSRAGMATTDSVDWGQLGPPFTSVPNPVTAHSNGGLQVTVAEPSLTNPTGHFLTVQQQALPFPPHGWDGNFAPGDNILYTNTQFDPANSHGPILIDFGTSHLQAGGGAQIDPNDAGPGQFVARITAYDVNGNVLGSFTENGLSTSAADNSAIFIGIRSSTVDIRELAFSMDFELSHTPNDFGINRFDFTSSAVPEPSSLTLLGLGTLGLVCYTRRRRNRGA
jgi:hypothetical protein